MNDRHPDFPNYVRIDVTDVPPENVRIKYFDGKRAVCGGCPRKDCNFDDDGNKIDRSIQNTASKCSAGDMYVWVREDLALTFKILKSART